MYTYIKSDINVNKQSSIHIQILALSNTRHTNKYWDSIIHNTHKQVLALNHIRHPNKQILELNHTRHTNKQILELNRTRHTNKYWH